MLLMGHMREGRRTTMKEYEVFKERFRQGLKESGLTPLSFSEKIGVPVPAPERYGCRKDRAGTRRVRGLSARDDRGRQS